MAYTAGKDLPNAHGPLEAVHSMSGEAKFFAHIANVAYNEPADRPEHQNEFKLDQEFNTDSHVVYTSGTSTVDRAIVGFRGTSDLLLRLTDDALLAHDSNMNRLNGLFEGEMKFISSVARKHPDADIRVTGHSLGGAIAMFVTVHTGIPVGGHIFNPGHEFKEELVTGAVVWFSGAGLAITLAASPGSGHGDCSGEGSHDNDAVGRVEDLSSRIFSHRVIGDPISMLFDLGIPKSYVPVMMNTHALGNFLDESRVPRILDVGSQVEVLTRVGGGKRHWVCAEVISLNSKSVLVKWIDIGGDGEILKRIYRGSTELRPCRAHNDSEWSDAIEEPTENSAQVQVCDSSTDRASISPNNVYDEDSPDWRSSLAQGSTVEVLAGARNGQRQWVRAEVIIATPSVLTTKWNDPHDGDELLRRCGRNSSEIRYYGGS